MVLLYGQEDQAAKQELDSIIIENCLLQQHSFHGFHYYFKWYDLSLFNGQTPNTPRKGVHIPLSHTLRDRMDAWIANRKRVMTEERNIVAAYITAVMNTSDSAYDWLRMLPEAVHAPIKNAINWFLIMDFPSELTDEQVETFLTKQERFLNVLKGRLALNLFI